MSRGKRVRETWDGQIETELLDACDDYHSYVKMFVSDKFKLNDIVRVTIERLPAPRTKGGCKK